MARLAISDLIVHDDDDRDPADYAPLTDGLSPAQAEQIMDAVDTFGAQQIAVSRAAADGSIVLQAPTGKMHHTSRLTRIDTAGEQVGQCELINRPR
jgi:hypothetical protein